MTRVLHVIDSLGRGGAERQLINLLAVHDRSVVDSHVVTLLDIDDLAPRLHQLDIPVRSLGLGSRRHWVHGVRRLRDVISELRPDVVHARLVAADLMSRLACVGTSVPLVSSLEAPTYSADARRDYTRVARAKLAIVQRADAYSGRVVRTTYLACSLSVAASTGAALRIPAARLRVVPNSTVVPDIPETGPAHEHLSAASEARLLVVGRLAPQKGHIHLLRALPEVLACFPNARLDIVGDGPLAGSLVTEVQHLGLAGSVRFHGATDDVPAFLRRAHLLVLPSLWEGLSIILLEGLAHAVPTIATDIPAARDVVRPGIDARLVPPGEPAPLARAIIELLGDRSARVDLATAGRQRVRDDFDVTVAARRIEAIYEELAAHAR